MGFFDRFRQPRTAPAQGSIPTPPPMGQPRFAVLDIETTGLSPESSRIVEIAIVTTDPWGRVLEEWSSRVNPQGPVGATHIHGITEADVANAPVFRDLIATLTQRLAGAAIAAHNAPFDIAFLAAEFAREGWQMPHVPALCTLAASQHHLPTLDRRRLADCCWAIGTPLTGAHSALGDARATAVLLGAFMNPHIGLAPSAHDLALPQKALGVQWPAGPTAHARQVAPSPRPEDAVVEFRFSTSTQPDVEPLITLVDRLSLADTLDEGAPEGTIHYLETLAEALEDGVITAEESRGLAAVARAMNLSEADIAAANRAFALTLANLALDDGKVTRAERAELIRIADLLGVDSKAVPSLLDQAERAREERLSAGLEPLPANWSLGEPLRVGDKVVFTGCEYQGRQSLEERSTALGVRVLNAVSPKVALLVSDDTVDGGKAARARELGTRVVQPKEYRILLAHLQPAVRRTVRPVPKPASEKTPKPQQVEVQAGPIDLPEGVTPADVRQWGRENGWTVGVRGRLNHEMLAAYLSVHSQAV